MRYLIILIIPALLLDPAMSPMVCHTPTHDSAPSIVFDQAIPPRAESTRSHVWFTAHPLSRLLSLGKDARGAVLSTYVPGLLVSNPNLISWFTWQKVVWAAATVVFVFVDAVAIHFLQASVNQIKEAPGGFRGYWTNAAQVAAQRIELRGRAENAFELDRMALWASHKKKTVVDVEQRLRRKLGRREKNYLEAHIEYLNRPSPIRGILLSVPLIILFSFLTLKGISQFEPSGVMALVKVTVTVGTIRLVFWLSDRNQRADVKLRIRDWHLFIVLSALAMWDFGALNGLFHWIQSLMHSDATSEPSKQVVYQLAATTQSA